MLIEAPAAPAPEAARLEIASGLQEAPPSRRPQRLGLLRASTFAASAALVLLYALRGGSYDLLVYAEQAVVVCWLVGLGAALGVLPRARPPRTALWGLGLLGALAAWTAAGLLWTESPERTTAELARTCGYLGILALFTLAVERNTWRAAAAGLLAGCCAVCIIALSTRLVPGLLGGDRGRVLGSDRLSYPFGYWNALAAWAGMAAAIALACSAHIRGKVPRVLAAACLPVAGATLYLTYSRSGVAGAVVGVAAVIVLGTNRLTTFIHAAAAAAGTAAVIACIRGAPAVAHGTGSAGALGVGAAILAAAALCGAVALLTSLRQIDRVRIPLRRPWVLASACALTLALAATAVASGAASDAWRSFTRPAPPHSSDPAGRLTSLAGPRRQLWGQALQAFASHPLDGTGAGTFQFWWDEHDAGFTRSAHSLWLQDAAELGLPGLLLAAGVMLSALAVVLRRARAGDPGSGLAVGFAAALVVYLLHASVDWMWESTAVTVLALAGAGVLAASGAARQRRSRIGGRIGLSLLALLAAAVQLPGILSSAALQRSQAAARAGEPRAALAWAGAAVRAEPWSASANEQRALVLEAAGRLRPAARDVRRAIAYEPANFRHWLLLARIEAESGRLQAAFGDLAEAKRLRPAITVQSVTPFLRAGLR